MTNLLSLDDKRFIDAAVHALSRPLRTKMSSFILHAALELSARVELLTRVSPEAQSGVRAQISALVSKYASMDECVEIPSVHFADTDSAWAALTPALERQDIEGADHAITFLATRCDARTLRAQLIDIIAPKLAAAAHTPILISDLESMAQHSSEAPLLLRGAVRQLAREIAPEVSCYRTATKAAIKSRAPHSLFSVLAQPPHVETTSTSIAPTLVATEASGLPALLLPPALDQQSWDDSARVLLRVGALSMLQEPAQHVPYGWTHCLTIPLGLLRNADVSRERNALLAIAATHVLAFRATLGTEYLQANFDVQPTRPQQALIDEAAQHHDAHVAKYALACLHATLMDADCSSLYFAAIERLLDWWRARD